VTRYLSLAEFWFLAEQVTGINAATLIKASRVDLADSALHAPQAGFGDTDFIPTYSTRPQCLPVGSLGTIRSRTGTSEPRGRISHCSSISTTADGSPIHPTWTTASERWSLSPHETSMKRLAHA
jgi:hypothetical protein